MSTKFQEFAVFFAGFAENKDISCLLNRSGRIRVVYRKGLKDPTSVAYAYRGNVSKSRKLQAQL